MKLASIGEKPRMITDVLPPRLLAVLEFFVIAVFGWMSIFIYREQRTHYWLTVL